MSGAPETVPPHVDAIWRVTRGLYERRRAAGRVAASLVALAIAAGGVSFVRNGEAGLLRRFGRVLPVTAPPGALYVVPFVERLEKVPVGAVRKLELSLSDGSPLEVTTGDENLLAVRALAQYRIEDPAAFRTSHVDAEAVLRAALLAALTRAAARLPVEGLLTTGKGLLAEEVRRRAQESADGAGTGLRLLSVSIVAAGPPPGAEEAFNAVASASAEKERRTSEAEGRSSEALALARGEADRIRQDAEGSRRERVEAARGASRSFKALAREVAPARASGLATLHREAVSRILPRARVIVLPPGGKGVALRTFLVEEAQPSAPGQPAASGGEAQGPARAPASGGMAPVPSPAPAGIKPSIIPEDLLPRALVPEEKIR